MFDRLQPVKYSWFLLLGVLTYLLSLALGDDSILLFI